MPKFFKKIHFTAAMAGMFLLAAFLMFAPGQVKVVRSENCPNAPSQPTLNFYPVTWEDTAGVGCTDFATIAVRNSNNSVYAPNANARVGDELYVRIYAHNGARQDLDESQTTAYGVGGIATISGERIDAYVAASNASAARGSVNVNIPQGARLEIVSGSGQFFNYQANSIVGADNLVSSSRMDYNFGDMRACFEFAEFYRFRVRVVQDQPQIFTATASATASATATVSCPNGQSSTASATATASASATSTVSQEDAQNKAQAQAQANAQAQAQANAEARARASCPGTPNLTCSANVVSANVGETVTFTASGGAGPYVWATSNNSNAGTGVVFNVSFLSGGQKTVTVRSNDGQTATCGVLINSQNQSTFTATATASASASATANCPNGTSATATATASANATATSNISQQDAQNRAQQQAQSNAQSQAQANAQATASANCGTGSPPYSQSSYYSQPSYYSQSSYYSQPGYYSQGSYQPFYTQSSYYSQPIYYSQSSYQVLGSNVRLSYSKRAFNDTKNADATTVVAGREDFITYTLTASNIGNAPANNFVITDDLSQVLAYANMVDNGGGSLNGNTLNYPGISVPAGGSVSRRFKVRVKYSLAQNTSYTMINTYGNTITVRINSPQILGAFVAPRTGADTFAFTFAGMFTAAVATFRNRKYLMKLIFT